MIIQRITVYGFRTLNRELTVPGEGDTFSRNINLIVGENETGKSSLMLAIVRALFDDHDTGGQQMERIRPWGTSVSPEITVEFTVDETLHRIRKQFLDNTRSYLEVREEGTFTPKADGSDADKHVRALFEGSRSRGPSGPSDWGIARAMYLRQETGLFEDRDDLEELTGQLGDGEPGLALSPLEEYVMNEINERFNKGYFTSTGKYTSKDGTPGNQLLELQKKLELERERLDDLEETKQEAEATRESIEKLQSDIHQNEEKIEAHRETIDQLEDRVDEVEEVREELNDLQDQEEDLEEELEEYRSDLEEMQALNNRIKETQKMLSEIEDRIEAQEKKEKDYENQRSELQKQIDDCKGKREKIDAQLDTAQKRKKAIELTREIDELNERLSGLEELEEEKQKIEDLLSERPVPDDEQVKELQNKTNELRDRKAELEAVGLSVTISAGTDWTVSLGSNVEDMDKLELSEEEETTEHFDNRVYIEIPGTGSIEVASQADEIQEIAEDIEKLEADRNNLFDHFSVDDLGELRNWKATAETKQEKRDELRARQTDLLGDFSDRKELRQNRNEQEKKRDRLLNELEEAREDLPDESPELKEFRGRKKDVQDKLNSLQDQESNIQNKLEDTREKVSEEKQNRVAKKQKLENAREQRNDMIDRHESEEKLKEQIEELEEQLDDVRQDLQEIRKQIPDKDEDPETRIEELEHEIDELDQEIRDDEKTVAGLENEMEGYQDEGLSGKINQKEEQIEYLQNQIRSERSRARAIKFLKRILDARREERVRDIVKPLQEQTNRYFRRITGKHDRTIHLNEQLAPAGLEVPEQEEVLDFQDLDEDRALSGGAREQLLLSLRIAAARQISGDEPRFLILDDVLGNTDPDRYEQILKVLNGASDHLQIFLLTSNPDRYRDLENSKEIDLERLKLGLE